MCDSKAGTISSLACYLLMPRAHRSLKPWSSQVTNFVSLLAQISLPHNELWPPLHLGMISGFPTRPNQQPLWGEAKPSSHQPSLLTRSPFPFIVWIEYQETWAQVSLCLQTAVWFLRQHISHPEHQLPHLLGLWLRVLSSLKLCHSTN